MLGEREKKRRETAGIGPGKMDRTDLQDNL